MRKRLALAAVLLGCLLGAALFPCASALAEGDAEKVSTADLLERWQEYDGREVVLEGEVVGDVMRRGDYAWITVNDDAYSREARLEAGKLAGSNSGIGVWLPVEQTEGIEVLGEYGTMGDFVRVRGIFNADCGEHGGDFDIHAVSLQVIDPGRELDTGPSAGDYLIAILSFLFLLASMTPFLRRRAGEMRSARALMRDESE